jgi:uncharacterized protein (DUF934 family)
MPRRLLRDGRVVDDDWVYLNESGGGAVGGGGTAAGDARTTPGGSAATAGGEATGGVILSMDQWLSDRPRWLAGSGPLGIVLPPAYALGELVPDLARFALVAADFPGPSEGRGYSQGRLLRERHGFRGELRAVGYVRRDQIFFLARCGFNSFELPDDEMPGAIGALRTFSAEYQPSNDAGLPFTPQRR